MKNHLMIPEGIEIVEFVNYREFLIKVFKKSSRVGLKSQLARRIKVAPSHISQVLVGKSDLSLEQAYGVSEFLDLETFDRDYFLLLVQMERSGSKVLRDYFEKKIFEARDERLNLKKRLDQKKNLAELEQARYYSSWLYSAVHVLGTISQYQNISKLREHLGVDVHILSEIIDFLEECRLVRRRGSFFETISLNLFLDRSSHMLRRHHLNWRSRAIQSIENKLEISDLHYTAVLSLSKKDHELIREEWIHFIQKIVKRVEDSKPEEIVLALNLDFFAI